MNWNKGEGAGRSRFRGRRGDSGLSHGQPFVFLDDSPGRGWLGTCLSVGRLHRYKQPGFITRQRFVWPHLPLAILAIIVVCLQLN